MSKDTGGFAFPREPYSDGQMASLGSPGMTLRDWFAGQALAGLAACATMKSNAVSVYAEDAYALADAMLLERSK